MNETTREESDIEEFLTHGYTKEEIERMSDEEFVYTAIMLVDGKSKEDIGESLGKSKKEVFGCVDERKHNLRKPNYEVLIKKKNIFYKE